MGPLTDLKVVELASLGPGPFCAMLLADLGADVVRIERPGGSDRLLARGRPAVAVDLKSDSGRGFVLRLVEAADVLIEGYRPGVAERLGIGPEECHSRNPQLVYGRMTGWGQEGPLAHTAGHDINYIAMAGTLGAIGRAGRPSNPAPQPRGRLRRRWAAVGVRDPGRVVGTPALGARAGGRCRHGRRLSAPGHDDP